MTRRVISRWIERKLAERHPPLFHECELCGDIDTTHEALSTAEVVCWHCAEEAGEFVVPSEFEWRVDQAL